MIVRMEEIHVDQVVRIHLESFRGFFLTFLGAKFLRHYYRGVIHEPNAVKLVAIEERKLSGFIVGTLNPSGFYSSLLKRAWLRFAVASIPALLRRPNNLPRLMRAFRRPGETLKDPKIAELSSIAVRPDFRGRGIGKRLVTSFIEECKRRGATKIYLTTDAEQNEHVNAFYKDMGFQVGRIFRTPEKRLMNEYWYEIQ